MFAHFAIAKNREKTEESRENRDMTTNLAIIQKTTKRIKNREILDVKNREIVKLTCSRDLEIARLS